MTSPVAFVKRAIRLFGRIFPRCSMVSQAIAFNLFLAFFPTLLIVVGLATSSFGRPTALFDLIKDFVSFLPPGSHQIVSEFLVNRGPEAWKWALVGWGGTLLAGMQVMRLLMEGIHLIYNEPVRPSFLGRQIRALLLLLLTIAPMLVAAILGIFGRPLLRWLAYESGKSDTVTNIWTVFYHVTALLLGMIALTLIYWMARPKEKTLRGVLPGAMIATILWWVADLTFGYYVSRVPYGEVYGGVAAVIGLMIWMELSTLIIFFGAAWNAELAAAQDLPPGQKA